MATVGAPVLENRLPGLTSGVDPFASRLSPVLAGFAANTSIGDILIGHGTGTALGAARYVTGEVPNAFESAWYSPYYMFGIWGLLVIRVALRGGIPGCLGRRAIATERSADGSRPVSSPISSSKP